MLSRHVISRLSLAALVVALAAPAMADRAPVAAPAPVKYDRIVAIAPVSSLGAEDKTPATKKVMGQIEQAISAMPGTKVIAATTVSDAIGKAKKPQLRQCEGDTSCLAEIGKLVGATVVVTGEIAGLGESKVVYLGATDVAQAKQLGSTTLTLGAKDTTDSPSGAAIRLLAPDSYKGSVHFALDVSGATIYVNGVKQTLSARGEVSLPVGTQAIRVTHPQYRDFVRFVDVTYGNTTEVPVGMQQYATVEHDVRAKPTSRDKIDYIEPPLWRRWYVAGPAIVVLGVTAGIIAYAMGTRQGPHADTCVTIGPASGCN
jgi:hypothetical protein